MRRVLFSGRRVAPAIIFLLLLIAPPFFSSFLLTLVTQALMYLGDLAPRGMEPQINLDLAKFNIDLLGILEEKTRGNLDPEEQKLFDSALYEARTRFVNVASQYATV